MPVWDDHMSGMDEALFAFNFFTESISGNGTFEASKADRYLEIAHLMRLQLTTRKHALLFTEARGWAELAEIISDALGTECDPNSVFNSNTIRKHLTISPFANFYLISQALPHFVDAARYLTGSSDKEDKNKDHKSSALLAEGRTLMTLPTASTFVTTLSNMSHKSEDWFIICFIFRRVEQQGQHLKDLAMPELQSGLKGSCPKAMRWAAASDNPWN